MDNKDLALQKEKERKKKVVKAVVKQELEFIPKDKELDRYIKIPLSDLSVLGIGWDSFAAELQSFFQDGKATSGLYRVTVPSGGELMPFKNEKAFLGSVKNVSGGVGGGQARLVPLTIDPASLCTAVAMLNVEMKLNRIQELTQEMLSYLKEKDRAQLEGALQYLVETWTTYKFNWDNNAFSQGAINQVQVIKNDSLAQISHLQKQIRKKINSKTYFSSKKVREKTSELKELFETYELATYVYSMAAFIEAVLLGNYRLDFLNEVIKRIEAVTTNCNSLQQTIYATLVKNQQYAEMAKDIGWGIIEAGTLFLPWAKLPNLNAKNVAQLAKAAQPLVHNLGELDKAASQKKSNKLINDFFEDIREETGVFVESINSMAQAYNNPPEMLVDADYLYLEEDRADNKDDLDSI